MCQHFDIYMYGYNNIYLFKIFDIWVEENELLLEKGFFNGIHLFTLKETADKYNPIWLEYEKWAIKNGMPTTTTNDPVQYKNMIDSLDKFIKKKNIYPLPLKHNEQQTNTNTKQINKMTDIINDPIDIIYQSAFQTLNKTALCEHDSRMVNGVIKQFGETFLSLMSSYIEYIEKNKNK